MGLLNLFKMYRQAKKLERGDLPTTGPDFEPVQGVDVDHYARICKRLVAANEKGQTDQAALDQILSSEGVDPARWVEIADVWNDRVMKVLAVKTKYSETFLAS